MNSRGNLRTRPIFTPPNMLCCRYTVARSIRKSVATSVTVMAGRGAFLIKGAVLGDSSVSARPSASLQTSPSWSFISGIAWNLGTGLVVPTLGA